MEKFLLVYLHNSLDDHLRLRLTVWMLVQTSELVQHDGKSRITGMVCLKFLSVGV